VERDVSGDQKHGNALESRDLDLGGLVREMHEESGGDLRDDVVSKGIGTDQICEDVKGDFSLFWRL